MGNDPTPAGTEWARWLDSMEGVPEWPPPSARKPPAGWQQRVGRGFERLGELVPGVALALGLAVACVTLFGLVALFAYPFFAFWALGGDPRLAGVFLGTAIHDTAQVAGAGLIYQQQFAAPEALTAAAVTKLVRNTCMAAVIPLMAVLYLRSAKGKKARLGWHQAVPGFVLAFVAASGLRTLGDLGERLFGLLSRESWAEALA